MQRFIKKAQSVAKETAELNNEKDKEVSSPKLDSSNSLDSRRALISERFEEENLEEVLEGEIVIEKEDLSVAAFATKSKATKPESDENLFCFKCHICDEPEFSRMFQLSAHTRSKHDCLPMVKCFCDKYLSTMRALERHRSKHFPRSSDLRCSDCAKTFKTLRGLDNHFTRWHGPNKSSFICSSS